jgi:hypothetical protein
MTGEEADVSAFGAKKGTGKTGDHLWYHNIDEYKKLLKEWMSSTNGEPSQDMERVRLRKGHYIGCNKASC